MTTPSRSDHLGPPRPPRATRGERFREIRNAIMAAPGRMKPIPHPGLGGKEMRSGPFFIHFHAPGALGPRRGYNLVIWPAGVIDDGHLVLSDKVANVDWDQRDNVEILTFRSGPWEGELLRLLRNEGNVLPFG